ncbi:hypothetical protein ACFFJN_13000 [Erwinia mallotivora]|uniref:hypothetical protein n=1 Tax=Erwinia mallotivora TaxID=69222 RepID=UPI0035E52AD4
MVQFITHSRVPKSCQSHSEKTDAQPAESNFTVLNKMSGVVQATLSFNKTEHKGNISKSMVENISQFCGNEEIKNFGGALSFHKAFAFSKVTGMQPPKKFNHLLHKLNSPETSKEEKSQIGKEINECRKYNKFLEEKYSSSREVNNNVEHIIPQSILRGKGFLEISDKEKSIGGEISNRAAVYLENQTTHGNHTLTRWLIESKKEKNPLINFEVTTKNRDKIQTLTNGSTAFGGNCGDEIIFDNLLGMHYIRQDDIFFDCRTEYYYDKKSNNYFDSNGNLLSAINGAENRTVKEVIKHESERVSFSREISSLIRNDGDVSSAIQLNQLGYAHIPAQQRDMSGFSNNLADASFGHMIQNLEYVVIVNDKEVSGDADNEKTQIHLRRWEFTPEMMVEAIIARVTTRDGEYPTTERLKEFIRVNGINLPEKFSFLNMPVVDEDKTTPALSDVASRLENRPQSRMSAPASDTVSGKEDAGTAG